MAQKQGMHAVAAISPQKRAIAISVVVAWNYLMSQASI